MVWITRISETQLRIESNHGPVGISPGLNRLISRLKTRGCIIMRTGHSGLVIVTGSPKLIAQWNKSNIKINERFQGNC